MTRQVLLNGSLPKIQVHIDSCSMSMVTSQTFKVIYKNTDVASIQSHQEPQYQVNAYQTYGCNFNLLFLYFIIARPTGLKYAFNKYQ